MAIGFKQRKPSDVDPRLQAIRDQVPRNIGIGTPLRDIPAPEQEQSWPYYDAPVPYSPLPVPPISQAAQYAEDLTEWNDPVTPSPEAETILNQPPMAPRSMREQVRQYAATQPTPQSIDAGIDAEAAMRRKKGITSVGPRFSAPPGMMIRNEAGRGTPLIRSDRPYFAPGTMLAAAEPVAPRDDPAVMAQLEEQQRKSLEAMNSAPFVDPGVEQRRKEYVQGNEKLKSYRIGLKENREKDQAALTEKAKDRQMSPQQRGMKQFVQSVNLDDEVAANLALGPEYAKYNQQQFDNENKNRETTVREGMLADAQKRTGIMESQPDPITQKQQVEDATNAVPETLRGNIENRPAIGMMTKGLASANPAGFFGQVPMDYLLRNPAIARAYGPQLQSQYGADALLEYLGGAGPNKLSAFGGNTEAILKLTNQQNLLRQLLGLPMYQQRPTPPTPENVIDPRYGNFQGIGR
jgi:hypothetical protein